MTLEKLKEWLRYDEASGNFYWLKSPRNGIAVGDKAGHKNQHGYNIIGIEGCYYRAARLAWLFTMGKWPEREIDHVDRSRSNDRIDNLKDTTRSLNNINRGLRRDSTSTFAGVSWRKKKARWIAYGYLNGKQIWIGSFTKLVDAVQARQIWEDRILHAGTQS